MTNGSGVPSISSTLPASIVLSNTTNIGATTGVGISATNGVLTLAGQKSAGNNENLTVDFETTDNQVTIGSSGATTISLGSLALTTTGAGTFGNLQTGANGADGQFTIYSEQGGTDYSLVFQPNATMTESSTYVWPAAKPASNKVLQSDSVSYTHLTLPTIYSV